jgi:bacteriorhodopsin
MKITALFLTLALGADTQGADASSQGADASSQGADQQQGYGHQESYAPEQSYGEAAPMYVKTVEQCFQGCPAEAPCMGYGGCQPRSCGAAPVPSYAAPVSYGAQQQSGYRRLEESDNSYGYEAPAAQSAPVQSYAAPLAYAPAMAAPAVNCGCPAGTVDTSHLSLDNSIILWIAFALLFLPGLIFVCRGFEAVRDGGWAAEDRDRVVDLISVPRIFAGVVCLVASLAYLTMATGHGFITKCNGRDFYYARYVDWAITTPLMLWDILTFANASHLTKVFIAVMDIFMIVSGLIGELIEGGERWAFFGFSMLAFIPIIYFLCMEENSDGVCCGARPNATDRERLFQRVLSITVITWVCYPIVWILATTGGVCATGGAVAYGAASYGAEQSQGYRMLQQGVNGFCAVGVISATGEAWIYTILDVLAKSVFGGMIVCHNWTNIRKCLIFHDGCGCSEKATRDGHSKTNDYDDEDFAAAIVSTSGL